MPIRRTYQCETCAFQWTHTHPRGDDPYPPCPNCQANDPAWRPQRLHIRSNRTRAAKVAQDILEKDYGLTNFRDGAREGETTHMGLSPQTTSEREKMVQQVAESTRQLSEAMTGTLRPETQAVVRDTSQIFSATNGQVAAVAANPQMPGAATQAQNDQMMALAKMGTMEARHLNHGRSPMELLHGGLKSGKIDPLRTNIMARAPIPK